MHRHFNTYWAKLKRRFKWLIALSIVIPLSSSVLWLMAISNFGDVAIPFAFWMVYLFSIVGLLLLWNSKWTWSHQKLIEFLHQHLPGLEYSLSIFFKNELNSLEKLQQEKVLRQLPAVQKIAFPIPLRNSFILLIFSGLLFCYSLINQMEKPRENQLDLVESEIQPQIDSSAQEPIQDFNYQLKVYPPTYTRLKSFEWKKGEKIAEGSQLVFTNIGNINFRLLWQNQYEFSVNEKESKSFKLNQPSIYQIEYLQNDSVVSLKPEVLEMLRDKAPILSTDLKENRHEIDWEDLSNDFQLNLNIQDDYGIESTDIIMTLSRGEGESVKFREMKQAISAVSKRLKEQQINISLPLDTFSLEPGDELYFYFSVMDNKQPKGNRGRTDVYFLSVADTVESEPVSYEGFALTNEAEYFKSQRQIIIDTEQLLKEQNQISQDEFEQRSNSIGADQKLLRLRYGVFLGEEYETTGGLGEIDHTGHDHGDVGGDKEEHDHGDVGGEEEEHDHDHESHEGHDHGSEASFSNPIFNETPELEAYVHAHDESELSTFLDAKVKEKLKAALTNMWEAELFLRTYKPKKALPFEYKALKLIKEVKRASRIYVERMGFEPPPIDEDKKRLTGDLDEIDAEATESNRQEKPFEEILAETFTQLKSAYQKEDINSALVLLDDFADDLVLKITTDPVRYGSLLAAIKQLQNNPSTHEVRNILTLMEDMLEIINLENGKEGKSIRSSLHHTYYNLLNE